MEHDVEARRTKDRSPRFPFISLEKALDRALQFYEAEKRGTAPFSSAAKHWGYSATSSGALQTLAALKSYGLIEGASQSLRLTEAAQRILLDKRPDTTERDSLKRQASLAPAIAAEIAEKWPDGLPSDHTLEHFFVLERGFNEGTASKALQIIKQNQLFTGAFQSFGAEIQSEDPKIVENMENSESVVDKSVRRSARHGVVAEHDGGAWRENTNDPNGLRVSIQIDGEPDAETFEYLQEFFEFKKAQLAKKRAVLQSGNDEESRNN